VAAALKNIYRSRKQMDPGFGHNADEQGLFDMISVNSNVAQRNAMDLVHFRTDRSWIERSANHPYFGMYPLSYMWGKVLPELVEFLVFRPFGLKAPFVALNTVQNVYQAVMEQQAYDPELRAYLAEHEDSFRALAMLVPGLPWDLPVNSPLWMRRIAEAVGQQNARVVEGTTNPDGSAAAVDITKIDYGRLFTDVAGYSLNPVRGFENVGETVGAAAGLPGMAADIATGNATPEGNLVADTAALTTEQQAPQAPPQLAPQPEYQPPAAPQAPQAPTVTTELESLLENELTDVTEALGGG
jgi:hypothetical protein